MSSSSSDLPPALRSLWRTLKLGYKAEPKLLLATFGLTLFAAAPDGAVMVALMFFVDGIAAADNTKVFLAALAVGLLAVGIWLFAVVSQRITMRFSDRVTVALESHVAHLQASALGLEHHERPEYLDRLAVLRNQVFALNRLFGSLFSTIAAGLRVAFVLAVLAVVHPALALLGLFAIPPIIVAGKRAELIRTTQELSSQHNRLARHLFELGTSPSAAKEIRISGVGETLRRNRHDARERWYRPVAAMRWRSAAWQAATWSLFGLAYGGAVIFVSVGIDAPVGQVLLVLIAGNRVSQYLSDLVSEANFLRGDWLGASQRLAWLEDYALDHSSHADLPVPQHLNQGVNFEGVSFVYPGTSRRVLDDVDLAIPAGTVVAVVGENGAGKTTLVKLLCRFYEPTEGRITVDGADLKRFPAAEWRQRITGTFQDFFRFEFTAQRSIGVGDLSLLDDASAVESAASRAGASDVVRQLPRGLQSQLGPTWEGGSELSFGQWQKLAVARGLMRDYPLIRVLDEPTAALDSETEHDLFERYAREARAGSERAITILISHRFSTVRMADFIVVVNGAHVLESGSHDELVAAGGCYAELYGIQATSYRR